MEAPARLALPLPRRHGQARHPRLLRHHQEAHGPGDHQEEAGQHVLLGRRGVHPGLHPHVHQLLHLQQRWRGHCADGEESRKVFC